MAIILMESFDQYQTAQGYVIINGWTITDNNANIISSTPRTGTRCLHTSQHVVTKTIPGGVTPNEIIYSAGFRCNHGAGHLLWLREVATNVTHLQLKADGLGHFQLWNGAGSVQFGNNSEMAFLPATWYWIEVRVKVHDTLGEVEMRVGGTTEIGNVGLTGPLTGLDTKNGGTGYIDQLYYHSPFFGSAHDIDDIVVIDPTVSPGPTDFIGDSRVECLFPNGNGNSSQWLGSDANNTDNYLLVDEVPTGAAHDSDSTYVESPTVGNKDTYAYPNTSLVSGLVHAVQPTVVAKKSSAGTRKIVQVSRLAGGTEYDSPEYNLSDTYTYSSGGIQHEKPGGGAWTTTDVNGAEFGVKVSA